RQARLLAAGGGDAVDVELAVALAAVDQRLAVRRPPVEVGRARRRDELRHTAGNRDSVDEGFSLSLGRVAEGQQGAVRGDAVVVVAARGEAGVKGLRLTAGDGDAVDAAVTVVEQRLAVAQPVGRVEAGGRDADDAAVPRVDRLRL